MAFRYRERALENGDIMDPSDWNDNMTPLIEELNTGIDRDNIGLGLVDGDNIVQGAFTKIFGVKRTTTITLNSNPTMAWQRDDGTNDIASVEFTTTSSGMLSVEWGATWQMGGATLVGVWGWRVIVDGIDVAHAPLTSALRTTDTTYLNGSVPLDAGAHDVVVEFRIALANDFSITQVYLAQGITALVNYGELVVTWRGH